MTADRLPDLLFGRFRLERSSRRLLAGDDVIALPPDAFQLLEMLALRKGEPASKDEIMVAIWADAEADYLLAQTIVGLREALDAPGATIIETVPRRGYRMAIPVDEVESQPSPPPASSWLRPFRDSDWEHSWTLTAAALAATVVVAILLPRSDPADELPAFTDVSMTAVTDTGDVGSSAMSRDGRVVAYVRRREDGDSIWVRRLTTGADSEVVPDGLWPLAHVTVSPDGDWLYFVSVASDGPSALWRVETLGGAPAMVLADLASPAAVSPDGRHLAFVRLRAGTGESALLVAEADGRGVRELFSQRMPLVIADGGLDWSPDGGEIAVIVRDSSGVNPARVLGVNVDSGGTRTLAELWSSSTATVQWQCEERSLLVVADGQLWHIPVAEGSPDQITREPMSYRSPSVGEGCGRFAAVEERETSAIWIAPDGTLSAATKLLEESGPNHGIAWLPDGRIVYEATRAGNVDLWVADAAGIAPRQLTTDPAIDASPAVTPDGRFVVFMSTRAGGATIWRTALDGSEARQLSAAGAHYAPEVSPDGRTIVYHSADAELAWVLMRMGIDGGNATRLADRPATFPVFSPDGMLIASNYRPEGAEPDVWSIALLRASDGVPMQILNVPGPFTRRLAWTADGSALMVSNPDRQVLRIPLDGGEPTTLVEAPPRASVMALSVARGGGRVAFVRGEALSDAVLFTAPGR